MASLRFTSNLQRFITISIFERIETQVLTPSESHNYILHNAQKKLKLPVFFCHFVLETAFQSLPSILYLFIAKFADCTSIYCPYIFEIILSVTMGGTTTITSTYGWRSLRPQCLRFMNKPVVFLIAVSVASFFQVSNKYGIFDVFLS